MSMPHLVVTVCSALNALVGHLNHLNASTRKHKTTKYTTTEVTDDVCGVGRGEKHVQKESDCGVAVVRPATRLA